jgi:cytidylate kinase
MKRDVLTDEMKAQLVEAKNSRDETFAKLDQLVLESRLAGATFREIAETTGMSVAWVQQALWRADPEQQRYVKRRHHRRVAS